MLFGHKSAWTYQTSGSVGAGYGIYAGEAGELVLNDPSGKQVTLKYAGGGLGPGIGVKLPKALNRLLRNFLQHELSGSVGPLSFNSSGQIYVTNWCPHQELTRSDFSGGCIFGEVNIALLKSRSITLFLLGMDLASLAALMAGDEPTYSEVMSVPPRAIMLSQGTGLGVGIGADIFAGGVA